MPTSYVKSWGRKIGSEPVQHRKGKADVDLTEREREVLHPLMEGCSNKEMAGRMYVSESTIKNHLSSIFAKMEVRDRT
ncbi:response regulator transcription factor [Brevibacillus fluminis]|nr:helix-turn-helix transcriptional regulator [Brevibacillus fluminis]